jgi:hypothetical protein
MSPKPSDSNDDHDDMPNLVSPDDILVGQVGTDDVDSDDDMPLLHAIARDADDGVRHLSPSRHDITTTRSHWQSRAGAAFLDARNNVSVMRLLRRRGIGASGTEGRHRLCVYVYLPVWHLLLCEAVCDSSWISTYLGETAEITRRTRLHSSTPMLPVVDSTTRAAVGDLDARPDEADDYHGCVVWD